MDGVREMVECHERFGIKAVTTFPAGYFPQVAINDKKFYPLYAKCVELDIPIFCCVGVPGPAGARWSPRRSSYIDEVCWFFPELTFVMRHGAEPWTELAVKLMLKWPNLYYSTCAFAPEALPEGDHRLRQHARRRQGDVRRLLPGRAHLDRIFSDMPDVPFTDEVWPKFLRENAVRVFKLCVGARSTGSEDRAFRWTPDTGVELLPAGRAAMAISGDGLTIAACCVHHGFSHWPDVPFLLRAGASPSPLPMIHRGGELPYGISADGKVALVGPADSGGIGFAWRWSQQGGAQPVVKPSPEFLYARPLDASGDGSVVVGTDEQYWGRSFVWTAATGPRRLLDALSEAGVG